MVTPRVLLDNKASGSHTVIEVNGRDRPGLLFEVTRALTGLNLQVSSAKISTYGEKVVDVFYVKDLFGHKIEHSAKLAEIQRTLEVVLAKGNESALTMASREPAAAE
jgi:[protein-PII] uridylyltransferase